jgi:hypothetical protein
MKHSIIVQVQELLSRNLNMIEIASRLKIDIDTVRIASDIIQNIMT